VNEYECFVPAGTLTALRILSRCPALQLSSVKRMSIGQHTFNTEEYVIRYNFLFA
jgi:hypothetical protein